MMNDTINHNLQRASVAWSRLFHNTTPITRKPSPLTTITTQTPRNNTAASQSNQPPPTIAITNTNLTQNIPWGDEIQEKEDHVLRIYAQNVNGIKIAANGGQYSEICDLVKEVKADIFCFQEHNLDTTQFNVRKILHSTTSTHWQRSRLVITSSPIEFSGHWKPGGTAILSNGHVTGRIISVGRDKWGRWSFQTILGQRGRRFTIISAYQVVAQKQALKGQYTSATQQHTLLLRQQDPITDPRKAFRRDLTSFLNQLRHDNHGIILVGDFNERLGDDPAGMSRIASDCELMDLMKFQHPHLTEVATYARGKKRLDFILGSPEVAHAIEKSGYEPFNYRFHTDHRAYFMDLNTKILFGATIQPLAAFTDRVLHSNNIRQVTNYIQIKHRMLTACNAFERGNQLAQTDNRHDFAERLDADVLRCSLSAEKRIRKYKEPAWSIELAEARKKVSILNKSLSMARTNIDHTGIIQREMNKLATPILYPESVEECSTELRKAKREVSEIISRSFKTRESEREEMIARLEADVTQTKQSKAKARILRNLKKAEELRKLFLKIKTLRQSKQRNGITRIEIPIDPNDDPKTCINWKTIDVPTEIMHHLQQRNRRHFGQAHGTPFTVSPLSDELGFTSSTPQGTLILDGHYDASNMESSVQDIIHHLTKTTRSAEISIKPTISESAYLGKLKSWRESTSTSPSGLHLGHYKAMIARHEFSDTSDRDPQKAKFDSQRNEIIKLHLQLLNYALERGYSFTRWQNVTNAMIYKEPGNYKIHRTRVIHLYEADYNLAMGLKWKEAMTISEERQELNSGQYGSRPSRGAHDPVFIEEFQLEISRASRKTLLQINYDATSCYDRIIPNLASLASQKYGVPLPTVLTNVRTLEAAKYKLKTDLGTSEQWYQHTPESPIYGTGQGSGNSPMIWCFISSLLFDCYDKRANGAIYETPNRSHTTKLHMIGYVDDSNGQTNQFLDDLQPLDQTIINKAQQDAQQWHDLLQASGGALEIPKCVYQILSWTFNSDGSPLPKGLDNTHKIVVHDRYADRDQHIPSISAHTAHKTLGHHKDPAGNQQKQRHELEKKCATAAAFITNSPLTREEAWTYYFAIFQTSVGYPLAASHFTKPILDGVQRKFMSILFAKCGYNRKTKREILYGPASLGGANFRSLYTIQGTGQVLSFIKYWRSPSQAGKLLRIAVAWTQYAIGLSKPFLSNPGELTPHMEVKWLKSLRDYLQYTGASLTLDNSYVPQLERAHDQYIMDIILQSGKYDSTEIITLNHCRLYLQAVTLSDITIAKGDKLDLYLWALWRSANTLWSDSNKYLFQPLTTWLRPPSRLRRKWPVYADHVNRLYTIVDPHSVPRHQQRYIVQQCYLNKDGQPEIKQHGTNDKTPVTTEIPDIAIPVTIKLDHHNKPVLAFTKKMTLHRLHHSIELPSMAAVQEDFHTYLHNLQDWESELLAQVHLTHDAFTVIAKMHAGFLAAGDGSVRYDTNGAFGWIISTTDGERLARANGPVRGYRPTSYRAEGYGILSILRFVKRLSLYCGEDPDWKWEMTSDNISLVDTVNGRDSTDQDGPEQLWYTPTPHDWSIWQEFAPHDIEEAPPNIWSASEHSCTNITLTPDWDILNEIRWSLTNDGIKGCTFTHIKGHQDRKKAYSKLSLAAQLNVDADRHAAKYQDEHGQELPTVLLFPHASVALQFQHGTCTSQIPTALRNAENHQALAKYIRSRNQWTQAQFDRINWRAMQHAIKRMNKQRIHFTKLVHDILLTNKTVHRHNLAAQQCPTCTSCLQEDRDHIMRCRAPSRDSWRAETITVLATRCKQLHTDPGLAQVLVQGTSQWLNGQEPISPGDFPSRYHRLILQQNDIGWRQLFNGRLCTEWARIQDDYMYLDTLRQSEEGRRTNTTPSRQEKRRRNGTQWSGEIIVVLWEQWYKVWVQRNSIIHGHDQASRARQQQKTDVRRLQSIYQSRHLMEPSVQDLLFDSIEDHQQQRSPTTIHNWLSIHETMFIQSMKQASKRAIQGVRSIRSYFPARQLAHTPVAYTASHHPAASQHITQPRERRPRTILSYFSTGRPPETSTSAITYQTTVSLPVMANSHLSPA